MRPATRADVAREANTSVAVVSYVINDGPRNVAPATRRRIQEAIARLDYRPNSVASALASGRTDVYGLVIPDISNRFFAEIAHAIGVTLQGTSKNLILGDSSDSKVQETALIEAFIRRRVDGLLCISVDEEPEISRAISSDIPVVMLDRPSKTLTAPTVAIDNIEAARAATDHLIENHNHKEIGIVRGPTFLSTARDRYEGWSVAVREAGLFPSELWQAEGGFTREGGFYAGQQLLESTQLPTAIFISNEQQAMGFIAAAAEQDIKIPEDIALITFDGTSDSLYSVPSMSTVQQPLQEIANVAVEMLETSGFDSTSKTCTFSLSLRRSCGC